MIHVWSAVQRRHASRRITEVYGIHKILVKLRACANSRYQAFLPERRGCEAKLHLDRLNDLVDPLAICADYGISFFLSTLQFVEAV